MLRQKNAEENLQNIEMTQQGKTMYIKLCNTN